MSTTTQKDDLTVSGGVVENFIGDPKSVIELVIPAEAESFSDKFKDCLYHDMTNIRKVTVRKGNPTFSSHCGVLYDKQMETLLFYPRAKHRKAYRMPDTVKTISEMAFTDGRPIHFCLEDVYISSNVTEIPDRCFANSTVWSVNMPDTLEVIGKEAFANTNLVCPTLPNNIKAIAKDAFNECERLHILNIPNKDIILTKDDLDLNETVIVLVETFDPIDHSKYVGLNVMNEEELDKWLEE